MKISHEKAEENRKHKFTTKLCLKRNCKIVWFYTIFTIPIILTLEFGSFPPNSQTLVATKMQKAH